MISRIIIYLTTMGTSVSIVMAPRFFMNVTLILLILERAQSMASVLLFLALKRLQESGHVQTVHEIRIDCDNDVVLLTVTQEGHTPGIACHTGRHSCFFSVLKDGQWQSVDPVLKNPDTIYK